MIWNVAQPIFRNAIHFCLKFLHKSLPFFFLSLSALLRELGSLCYDHDCGGVYLLLIIALIIRL